MRKNGYVTVQSIEPALFKKSFTQNIEADMLKVNCEEALDSMRAIYKVIGIASPVSHFLSKAISVRGRSRISSRASWLDQLRYAARR